MMDAPIWNNDILYLKEMIVILIMTVLITVCCFYLSKRDDRRHLAHLSQPGTPVETPPGASGE
jgi:hypothetical protein